MSAKPYTDEEVEWLRGPKYDFNPVVVPIHERWLATVASLQSRLAAAEAERHDLRRYRKSWDKELRDAREAAKTAIDGRIAAEAEAERARGLLGEAMVALMSAGRFAGLAGRIERHLASRPEGEVAGG